ncbi:MAG: SRPBCC domain-containing protein [Lewinella sp.]|nr:SRPBCC domain-containing protein [Lewinella sp.]
MRNLQTDILINATPDQVWATLTDFPAYPEWNPFIRKLEGPVRTGESIVAHLSLDGQKTQVFRPVVKDYQPGQGFRWLGHLFIPGLFDGEHYFQLEALPEGGTRLIHGENFSGLLAGVIMWFIGAQTQSGFERMNAALKERVEKGTA